MSRYLIVLSLVLAFVTGLTVMNHHHEQPPHPGVDSSIEILHYHDCFDVRSPVGWGNLWSINGSEYVESPLHLNDLLMQLCPHLYPSTGTTEGITT